MTAAPLMRMAGNRSIMVIDDEASIREVLQQALELDDYVVTAASNGLEGLQLLSKTQKPFLILVDLMMPIMDGWEFIQEIRKSPSLASIPIIVISAFREKAKALGIENVIVKPFDISELLETVGQYCN